VVAQFGMWLLCLGCGGSVWDVVLSLRCGGSVWDAVAEWVKSGRTGPGKHDCVL
jgi:hypothetical protein